MTPAVPPEVRRMIARVRTLARRMGGRFVVDPAKLAIFCGAYSPGSSISRLAAEPRACCRSSAAKNSTPISTPAQPATAVIAAARIIDSHMPFRSPLLFSTLKALGNQHE